MGDTPVTVDDLNVVKNEVASMSSQMKELLALVKEMQKAKTTTTETPLEEDPDDGDSNNENASNKTKDYHDTKWKSVEVPIPHPNITNRGDPPKLDSVNFNTWQAKMRSHICSSSNELWRVIESGFKPFDPSNLSRREVVDGQLNATALHMIQLSVGEKDWPYVGHYREAKDAWKGLEEVYLGNESMR